MAVAASLRPLHGILSSYQRRIVNRSEKPNKYEGNYRAARQPRTGESNVTSGNRDSFIASLKAIVGDTGTLTDTRATLSFRTGFRSGASSALAVIRPRSLIELWRVLIACTAAQKIIIMQAANTGLTAGSTPAGGYDRDVVIVNTMLIRGLWLIKDCHQVICLPGTTLDQLKDALEPIGREPHSVIGSSCIGASVIGGICNNSGGALVRRGPAYTEMSLFARLNEAGELELVNHLCVNLGRNPEEVLGRLERGEFSPTDIDANSRRAGSDRGYLDRLRAIDAESPARFNADPEHLFEASGSAGKIAVFAVRVDTFPKDEHTRVFYIGTRDPKEFTALRRRVLGNFEHMPVLGEYMHKDMFEVAAKYGKDAVLAIEYLGTKRLPCFFRFKRSFDLVASRWRMRSLSSDRILQRISRLLPDHLPARMVAFHNQFNHHLILKMAGGGIAEARKYLHLNFPSSNGDFFECTENEARMALLHRFVAAGAAIRYATVHADEVEDILPLDIALKRSDQQWFEELPDELRGQMDHALYYGHFFCHVFHQDYIVRRGCDIADLKRRLLQLLDARGAEYPAEHNVGHLYRAKPALAEFYRRLDPCNVFNPGIGQDTKRAHWRTDQ